MCELKKNLSKEERTRKKKARDRKGNNGTGSLHGEKFLNPWIWVKRKPDAQLRPN
jgi:hypothetical protein